MRRPMIVALLATLLPAAAFATNPSTPARWRIAPHVVHTGTCPGRQAKFTLELRGLSVDRYAQQVADMACVTFELPGPRLLGRMDLKSERELTGQEVLDRFLLELERLGYHHEEKGDVIILTGGPNAPR